jgi:hypothetical protein
VNIDVQIVRLEGFPSVGRLTDVSTTDACVEPDVVVLPLSSVCLVPATESLRRRTQSHVTGYVARSGPSGFWIACWDLAPDPLREIVNRMLWKQGPQDAREDDRSRQDRVSFQAETLDRGFCDCHVELALGTSRRLS